MTLINIADGTGRECRSKGGGKEVYPWRGGRRGTSGDSWKGTEMDANGEKEEMGVIGGEGWRVEGMVWVFIISPSRLDSVKLWNNPLMSLPCRVDRMPTKLPDFPLFLPALSFPSFLPFLSPTLSLSSVTHHYRKPIQRSRRSTRPRLGSRLLRGSYRFMNSLYAPWTA